VRIGNGALRQDQHDVWGALLDSVYLHTKSRDHLPERVWPILVQAGRDALENWREPDRGIWEVRGEPQHFTSSKLMCWVAPTAARGWPRCASELEHARALAVGADEIQADICEHALDDARRVRAALRHDALDASVLLDAARALPAADDERIRATVLAIADELTDDGLVLRYRVDETDDGARGEEGTFTICSFWLVSALVEIGELDRARELCEKLLSYASPLGLYAEEIDPRTAATSATSRRRSPTSRSSTPSCTSSTRTRGSRSATWRWAASSLLSARADGRADAVVAEPGLEPGERALRLPAHLGADL
jgi:GH15 family glucan-1,4-alpha-glucosidase